MILPLMLAVLLFIILILLLIFLLELPDRLRSRHMAILAKEFGLTYESKLPIFFIARPDKRHIINGSLGSHKIMIFDSVVARQFDSGVKVSVIIDGSNRDIFEPSYGGNFAMLTPISEIKTFLDRVKSDQI